MNESKAFLKAICDEPDEDSHRLVYADWLDEHGDPGRAEFIRVQIELARMQGDDPRRPAYARRECELLDVYRAEWEEEVPEWARDYIGFHRGFVWWVGAGNLDTFTKKWRALFTRHPITRLSVGGY